MVYVCGVALVAVSAIPHIMTSSLGVPTYLRLGMMLGCWMDRRLGAFVFVALGTGAIKPNVMNFGADQYDVQAIAVSSWLAKYARIRRSCRSRRPSSPTSI